MSLLKMHPSDLRRYAADAGRIVWHVAADQAEEAGLQWEKICAFRLMSLGGREVEVWQGCTVKAGDLPGTIIVRLWNGRSYKSSRTEWYYSAVGWQRWDLGRPMPGGTTPFKWVPPNEIPEEMLRAAVETALQFNHS